VEGEDTLGLAHGEPEGAGLVGAVDGLHRLGLGLGEAEAEHLGLAAAGEEGVGEGAGGGLGIHLVCWVHLRQWGRRSPRQAIR